MAGGFLTDDRRIRYQKKFTNLGTVGTVSDPPQLNKIDIAISQIFRFSFVLHSFFAAAAARAGAARLDDQPGSGPRRKERKN